MILQLSIDLFSLWQEGDSRFLLWISISNNNFYSLALNVIAWLACSDRRSSSRAGWVIGAGFLRTGDSLTWATAPPGANGWRSLSISALAKRSDLGTGGTTMGGRTHLQINQKYKYVGLYVYVYKLSNGASARQEPKTQNWNYNSNCRCCPKWNSNNNGSDVDVYNRICLFWPTVVVVVVTAAAVVVCVRKVHRPHPRLSLQLGPKASAPSDPAHAPPATRVWISHLMGWVGNMGKG